MALYSCLKVINDDTGTTPFTQTVTDVVDARTGTQFVGHTFLTYSCTTPVNQVIRFPNYGTMFNTGLAYATTFGGGGATGDVSGFVGLKTASGSGYIGYSFFTNGPYPFFGGDILDFGYISNVSLGSFQITWGKKTATFTTVSRVVLILGGNDWNIDIDNATWNGVHATTAAPKGVLIPMGTQRFGSTAGLSATTGAGGEDAGISWATSSGGYGCASFKSSGLNNRVQLHDRTGVNLGPDSGPPPPTPTVMSGTPIVSDWGVSSWTGAGAGGLTGAGSGAHIAFSGTGIVTASGNFNALPTDGSLEVSLGIDPYFIIFASVGMPDSSDVDDTQASLSIGMTDRINVGSIWTAENSLRFTADVNGVNLLSSQYLTVSGTPAGIGTLVYNKMSLTPITNANGIIEVSFTDTDGTSPNIIWFAVGIEATPQGTVEVDKVWDVEDPGQVTLRIGTTPQGDDIASQLTGIDGSAPLVLDSTTVTAGTYYISETHANLYVVSLSATINGIDTPIGSDGQITVADGDVVVVTITNRDLPPPAQVKQWRLYRFDFKPREEETG